MRDSTAAVGRISRAKIIPCNQGREDFANILTNHLESLGGYYILGCCRRRIGRCIPFSLTLFQFFFRLERYENFLALVLFTLGSFGLFLFDSSAPYLRKDAASKSEHFNHFVGRPVPNPMDSDL